MTLFAQRFSVGFGSVTILTAAVTVGLSTLLTGMNSPLLYAEELHIPGMTGGSAMDLLNSKTPPQLNSEENAPTRFKPNCTDADGKVLTPRNKNYEACLRAATAPATPIGTIGNPDAPGAAKPGIGFSIEKPETK